MANKKPVHVSVDPSVREAIERTARLHGMRRGTLASRLVLRGLGTLKRSLACPEVACAPRRGSDRLTVYLEPAMSGLAQCRFHDSTRAGSVRRALFAGLAPDVAEESLASDYGAGEGVEPPKAKPEPGPLARRVPELGRTVDPGDPEDLRAAIGDLESAARDLEAKAEACDREAKAFTGEIARDGLPAGTSALAKLEEARRNVEAGRAFARKIRARQRELEAAGGQATAQAWAFEDTEHRFWSDLDAKTDGQTLSTWPDGEAAGPRAAEARKPRSACMSARCRETLRAAAEGRGLALGAAARALALHAAGGEDPGFRVDGEPESGSPIVSIALTDGELAAVREAFPAASVSVSLRQAIFAPRNLAPGVGEPGDTPERIAGRLEGVAERVAAEAEGGGVLADVSDADLAAELSRRLGEARA